MGTATLLPAPPAAPQGPGLATVLTRLTWDRRVFIRPGPLLGTLSALGPQPPPHPKKKAPAIAPMLGELSPGEAVGLDVYTTSTW